MNSGLRCLVCESVQKKLCAEATRFFSRTAVHHSSSKKSKWSYWHNPGKEPLVATTIGRSLDRAADKFGDSEAIVSVAQNSKLTFSEVRRKAEKLAAGFIALGLNPGDKVGILQPNTEEWYISYMAGAKAGLIMLNINPASVSNEIEHCLVLSDARALIMKDTFKNQNYYESIAKFLPEIEKTPPGSPTKCKRLEKFSHLIIDTDKVFNGAYRLKDIYSLATKESADILETIQNQIQPDDANNIQYTSGTTGKPKATLLNHFCMLNNARFVGRRLQYDKKRHRMCLFVPLFHTYATTAAVLAGLWYGSTLVLPSPGYNMELAIESIVKEQCTALYGTPTMFIDFMSHLDRDPSVKSEMNVEFMLTAGSLLLPSVYDRLKKMFPTVPINSLYGLTETSPVQFQTLPTDGENERKHTVGFVQDHVEVKVVDREGKMVPFGCSGELWCRGYLNMMEYYNQEDKTAEIMGRDRWLKTGDEVILSENGYAQIVGRIKDMIIRGGENIFPREIENFLSSHPDIFEVQVYGVTDERMGEEVAAEIIMNPGKTMTKEEVKQFCKGKIAHYKIPRYIQFVTEFPKTGSGKIKKHLLRQRLEEALKQETQDR